MTSAAVVSVVVMAIWILVTLAQLGDVVASLLDRRAEHRPAPRSSTRALVWAVPAAFALSVPVAAGLAASVTMAAAGAIAAGALLAVGVAAAGIAIVWLIASGVAAQRSTRLTGLLDDLRAMRGRRVTPEALTALRSRFDDVASASTRSPTPGRRLSLRWRLIPVIVGVLTFVEFAIASWGVNEVAIAIASALALPAINGVLAVTAVRLAGAAVSSRATIDARHRTEIARLLDELDRSSRRGVAGLGDRVARALDILRDQQSGEG